jgi:hypothetical protein
LKEANGATQILPSKHQKVAGGDDKDAQKEKMKKRERKALEKSFKLA